MSDTTTTASEQAAPTLTPKQAAFVEHYLQSWNATEAARRAGYAAKTAHSIGWENLRKPEIRKAIEARLKEHQLTTDDVLARLADHAMGGMADFLSASGNSFKLDLKQAAARGKLHLIRKYSKTRQGVSLELYDAQAALIQIGRALGLFVDRQEVTGKDGGPIELADIKARLLSRFSQDDAERGAPGVPEPPAG